MPDSSAPGSCPFTACLNSLLLLAVTVHVSMCVHAYAYSCGMCLCTSTNRMRIENNANDFPMHRFFTVQHTHTHRESGWIAIATTRFQISANVNIRTSKKHHHHSVRADIFYSVQQWKAHTNINGTSSQPNLYKKFIQTIKYTRE